MCQRASIVTLLALALLVLAACGAGPRPSPTTASAGRAVPAQASNGKQYAAPPEMKIDRNKQYFALIKTTQGDIKVQLDVQNAPLTVNNFVFLARERFYDNVPFHRIIKGFMIQGGDPTGTGAGGPGYKFPDEPVKGNYEVGSIAMANSGPNTNGSQFFICDGADCATLPAKYNLFGKVVEGIDVVHAIASMPVTSNGRENSTPVQAVRITTVEIIEQ